MFPPKLILQLSLVTRQVPIEAAKISALLEIKVNFTPILKQSRGGPADRDWQRKSQGE